MKSLEHYLTLNYHKTVTQDDEGDYIVEVQELPGCAADGKTPNEAFENLREAMKSWLASRFAAGLEVPEPRSEEDYSGRILVRMARYLHHRLAAQSAREGVSLNQHLVTLLADASARVEVPATRSADVRYLPDVQYRSSERAFSLSCNSKNTALIDVTKLWWDPLQANPLGNCQSSEFASQDLILFVDGPRRAQYNQSSAFSAPADKPLLNRKKSESMNRRSHVPEVKQVFTIVRRLYSPVSVPWNELLLSTNLGRLGETYKFKEIGQVAADGLDAATAVVAKSGEFSVSDTVLPVVQLAIQPNLVEAQLATETEGADAFLRDLERFLKGLDPNKNAELQPYTTTHQTIAIVKLQVPFEALLSDRLREFLAKKAQPMLKLPDAEAHIRLTHLNWQVTFQTDSNDYIYQPKALALEPRAGSKPSDNLYYTHSPTDFATHMKLLQEFEATFVSSPVAKAGR